MRNRLIGAVAIAISVALLASSCAATSTSSGSSELVSAGTQVENRSLILQLELPQLDGAVFDPNTVANKDVLLWFWAPW